MSDDSSKGFSYPAINIAPKGVDLVVPPGSGMDGAYQSVIAAMQERLDAAAAANAALQEKLTTHEGRAPLAQAQHGIGLRHHREAVPSSPVVMHADKVIEFRDPAETGDSVNQGTITEHAIRQAIYERSIDRGGFMLIDGREVYYRAVLAAFGLSKLEGWKP